MIFNVCLCCGKSRCRCASAPARKMRAPIVSLKDASAAHVSDKAVIVFGKSENFDGLWGDDLDWNALDAGEG